MRLLLSLCAVLGVVGSGLADAGVPRQAGPALPDSLSWMAIGDSYSAGEGLNGTVRYNGLDASDCARGYGEPVSGGSTWSRVAAKLLRGRRGVQVDYRLTACTGHETGDRTRQMAEAVAPSKLWRELDARAPGYRQKCGRWGLSLEPPLDPEKPPPGTTVTDNSICERTLRTFRSYLGEFIDRKQFNVASFTFGGNNLGFSDIIKDCLGFDLSLRIGCDIKARTIRTRIAQLRASYAKVIEDVAQLVSDGGLVIVSGYPRPIEEFRRWSTKDKLGGACAHVYWRNVGLIRHDIVDGLNEALKETVVEVAEDLRSSRAVSVEFLDVANDVYEPSGGQRHGLCGNATPYINSLSLALSNSFHPTQAGYNAIGEEAYRLIAKHDFSLGTTPDPPDTTTTTTIAPTEGPPPLPGGVTCDEARAALTKSGNILYRLRGSEIEVLAAAIDTGDVDVWIYLPSVGQRRMLYRRGTQITEILEPAASLRIDPYIGQQSASGQLDFDPTRGTVYLYDCLEVLVGAGQ